MANDVRLTTIDNPFDPFDQFTSWLLFDNEKQYNTCGRLARIANVTDEMSDQEKEIENERAIDEIIKYDILDVYKKVSRKNNFVDEETKSVS